MLLLTTGFLVIASLIVGSFGHVQASRNHPELENNGRHRRSGSRDAQVCGGDVNEAENLKTFYCPSRQPKCSYKRDQRCTTAKVCLNPAGKEEGCEEATSPGRYEIFRGKSYIASFAKSSRDRKKRSVEDIKHWYLQYRGFVYEFGKPGVRCARTGYKRPQLQVWTWWNKESYMDNGGNQQLCQRPGNNSCSVLRKTI